ncbi:AAEL004824-PA, partial [Aedes aegypti]
LWALQMIDASAKVSSGLLRGNANQLGDYDLCTGIATKVKVKEDEQVRMRGKYCLAHIDVVAEDDDLKLPVHLLQGRGFIKSTLNDPDHFLPRFTTINWGICLPAACSYEDAGSIVKNFVKPYNTTGIKLFLEIEEGNCHVRQTSTWTKLFKENWRLVASLYSTNENSDDSTTSQPTEETNLLHQTLMSFSVKRTFRQLVGGEDETLAGKDVVGCLSGLRALATIALFCALRLIPMGFQPFTNRNEFTESFNTPWSVALRVLMLYADVYLVISGFLAAYHMVGEYQQKQKVAWFRRIVGRYLRLTLPLIPVLIFYSVVWEHLGSGPQWGDVVVKNANLCKHNFWNNILFVQNWYPVEESCAPHTFQLAVEMQLAILAPLLLIILTANPFYGIASFVLLHGLSTAMRFTSTNEDRLSPYIYHGIRLTQIYRTVNLSFSETLHRATPYLAGFGLGYLLREGDIRKQVDRGIRMSGWIGMAIACGWCFVFPLSTAEKEFQYDINDAAQYAALAPLSWALSICWIIYFCETHQASLLNRLLSCRMMTFLSKISYSVSLIQFLVFFYFAGTTRGSEVFSWSGYLNRTEICLLIFGGTLLTVLYDLPIQNIKAMLDRSVIRRPTGAQSADEEVKPEPEKPEPTTTTKSSSPSLYSRSTSYSPPYV